MPRTAEYDSKDPATKLVSPVVLTTYPIGVPDLTEAARLLQVPVTEVALASLTVTPWPTPDVAYWSVRQLARNVVLNRRAKGTGVQKITKAVPPGAPIPRSRMTPEVAELAAELAASLGVAEAARRFQVAESTLFGAWSRYGIRRPAQRLGPEHRPSAARKWTRESTEQAAAQARGVGIAEAARRHGASPESLRKAAKRYGVELRGRWTQRAA